MTHTRGHLARRCLAMLALVLAGAPAMGGGVLPPKVTVTTADCIVEVNPAGYNLENAGDLSRAGEDILRIKAELEKALSMSEDMRTKVKEACEQNGHTDLPELNKPRLRIQVVRRSPNVDVAEAHGKEKGQGKVFSGAIAIDMRDVENAESWFEEGSDPEVAAKVSMNYLTRVLAHEFDHLRDTPEDIERLRGAHHDPLGHRDRMGKPVEDENLVVSQMGCTDVRIAYGGDFIEYVMDGATARLDFKGLTNTNRRAVRGQRAGTATFDVDPGFAEDIPDEPCEGGGGGCWEPPMETDGDLDGVPDEADNCPELPNPQQLDDDDNGVGDDCEAGILVFSGGYASPFVSPPEGAVAWRVRHDAVAHTDGPFGIPDRPNPFSLPVLAPSPPPAGSSWAFPDLCEYFHLHGSFMNHGEPSISSPCGHGGLEWGYAEP